MKPSVLILAEELTFLLDTYSTLHQDARMGRVETATRAEAAKILDTFRPDVVVIDSSAAGSAGLPGIVKQCNLPYGTKIIVTCDEREGPRVAHDARAIGAVGFLRRESLSATAIVRVLQRPAATRARTVAAS